MAKSAKNPAAVKLAKLRAEKLSAQRRSEIANQGAAARASSLSPERQKAIARKAAVVGARQVARTVR